MRQILEVVFIYNARWVGGGIGRYDLSAIRGVGVNLVSVDLLL